ncbi:uncharacterized protein LOC128738179 [Sabethes cyaneus]|uniref:uncharacterized protein LOC128738179 n=1 Tax=Sabethes cyaneus TaxID=53552 RepID=UPI00237EDE30|nr:uncharacterized protein LOC128738179 [Sabethes cyaneus]
MDLSITSKDPFVRKEISENILNILQQFPASETPQFQPNNSSESDYSALSEPFSDLDESYILLDQRKRKPGDDEGDEMLLNQFTPEFRQVYDEMMAAKRDGEFTVDDEPFLAGEGGSQPDPEEELLQTEPGELSPEFKEFIEDLLNKCELKYHLEEKKKREAQKKKDRRARRVPSEESFVSPDNDSLSGVWRMLDAVSVENGFPISHNYYNLYDDRRFEWLIRDEVPWNQIEASKKKCEQWLKMIPSRPESK